MLPINFKNQSDISNSSLIDKQTQTSTCVSEQGSSVINIHPGATEQEVIKLLDYSKILSQTRILDKNKVHEENIKEHKQEVASVKSSQGKFLGGNIFQRENRIEPLSTRPLAWKLDESLDKESINSGYIYIPSAHAEVNQENVPNSARLQNKPSVSSENNEEDKGKLIKQPSSYSKISKEKISPSIGFTSIPIENVNIDTTYIETQMADKKACNKDIGPSGTEVAAERLNYIVQEIKSRLSSTLSMIMTPICAGACRQQSLIEEVNAKRKEEEERKIIEVVKPIKPDPPVGQANSGLLSSIRKSWSNLVCGTCPSCQARQASQANSVYQVVDQQLPSPPPPAAVDPPDLQCEPPPEEEKEEKQPCSPNKFCGPVITYPCPPPKPRDCGFEKESASLEFKSISPLVNEMSPNNEFVSDDYIFNNNDQPSLTHMDHMSADRNEHDSISKPILDVFDLSAVASSIKDDYIHSKPENLSMIKDNTIDEGLIQKRDHSGPIAKIIDVVESTVVSLKEHIDLDRISYFKNEVTESQESTEDSKAPSSEYFIRAVAPEPITQSHQFVPPRRSLFTSFKSTIFKFFGDGEKMEEPTDISSSSEMSEDSSNDESN